MNAATERIVPMIGYDHRGMCKHPSSGSQGLNLIMRELTEAVKLGNRQRQDTGSTLALQRT